MKLKILFSILAVGLIVSSASVTMAAPIPRYSNVVHISMIPQEELSLGGVRVGMSLDYVKSIYGEPKGIKVMPTKPGRPSMMSIDYGTVSFTSFNGGNIIHSVTVTANNGWKTPAGIGVGTDEAELVKTYGALGTSFLKKNGVTYYQYSGYHSALGMSVGIKDHKIVYIHLYADE